MPVKARPVADRFWRHVHPEPNSGCWLWSGAMVGPPTHRYGFIRLGVRGTPAVLAHRLSYEMHCQPIPAGMVICHRCDVPACVNPAHLMVGTQAINLADMHAKGRNRPKYSRTSRSVAA